MRTVHHRPGTLRWAGILLLAVGQLAVAMALSIVTTADQPPLTGIALVVGAGVVLVAAAVRLPWTRWPHAAGLSLAVGALALLVLVDQASGYGGTRQAAATYPIFATLVLAWVGLTQPRRTALAFTLCVGAALALLVLADPDSPIPLVSLLAVLPAGAALGEAGAWVMGELRRLQHHDHDRANALIDLTRALDQLPSRADRAAAAHAVAHVARRIFNTEGATVNLADGDRGTVSASVGDLGLMRSVVAGDGEVTPAAAASTGGTTGALAVELQRPTRYTTVVLRGRHEQIGEVILPFPPVDDPSRANLIRLFSAQATAALEQHERIRRLDHAMHHDELTGTGNRRHAMALLETLRQGDGLILIDVDGFKTVNDSFGHLAGDDVLRALGAYLASYVRGSDDVARLGGDEFIVVARGVSMGVAAAATRLLNGWRAQGEEATVSIGVAVHRRGASGHDTLDRADRALYKAKGAGRDRIGLDDERV